jgi:hypothetical protein
MKLNTNLTNNKSKIVKSKTLNDKTENTFSDDC